MRSSCALAAARRRSHPHSVHSSARDAPVQEPTASEPTSREVVETRTFGRRADRVDAGALVSAERPHVGIARAAGRREQPGSARRARRAGAGADSVRTPTPRSSKRGRSAGVRIEWMQVHSSRRRVLMSASPVRACRAARLSPPRPALPRPSPALPCPPGPPGLVRLEACRCRKAFPAPRRSHPVCRS